MSRRHSLLSRQIRRHFGGEDKIPADLEPFLAAVDAAYRQSDDDRAMLERSMDLSSQELMQTNTALRQSLSLVQATLESTADGLLVVDEGGRIVAFNHRFTEMWRLPREVIESRDDERAIAAVLNQLVYPEGFVARVRELYAQPDAESQDVLEFKDGRVWSFRDVTERRRA